MRLQTIIRPRLNRDPHTLALPLLRILDGLVNIVPRMPAQRVVQARDEFMSVVFGHGHECAAHYAARGLETG